MVANECVIKVKRIAKRETYTIGRMYIDGKYICDTIEDRVRPKGVKVYGTTAIPEGKYVVAMNITSPKFQYYKQYQFCKGKLPRLLNVPQFEGVLIHIGNTEKDTNGCILVGENKVKGQVINSTATFTNKVYPLLLSAYKRNKKIYCEVE